jgi:hypothetical protein
MSCRLSEVRVNRQFDKRFAARRCAALAVAGSALLFFCGCSRQNSPSSYEAVSGVVASVQPDTGQLTIRCSGARPETDREREMACLLTNDAEVYVNDRFAGFEKIAVGDVIELIGYSGSSPRDERFVVSFAYITRTEPPPPEPDLTPRATQPGG